MVDPKTSDDAIRIVLRREESMEKSETIGDSRLGYSTKKGLSE